VVKSASRIELRTSADELARLLLRQGHTPEEDEFVEVHVGGPITVRTLERVIVENKTRRSKQVRALKERLARFDVRLEAKSWTL